MNELSAPRRSRAPLFLAGGLGTVLAGAAAAVLLLGGGTGGTAVPTATPDGPVAPGEPVLMSAGQVLTRASHAAGARPALNPKPGQYLYFASKSHQQGLSAGTGQQAPEPFDTTRQIWLSVSGKNAGLIDQKSGGDRIHEWLCDGRSLPEGQKKEKLVAFDPAHPPTGCANEPAHLPNLPVTAATALKWLYDHSQGGNPPDVQAFTTVGDTIRERYIAPRSLAALFAAAAKLPGTKVYRDVPTLAGGKGIAVGQTFNGLRQELIFDPKTFQLIGERQVRDFDTSFRPKGGKTAGTSFTPEPGTREGEVVYASAETAFGLVDEPGTTP
ncbi:hypothetical protein GCM10010468_35370 [Actinocorallia longicatena]|uniref:CU044_5270 family protein n=2 Tax=Actinocorallia longicatena TaxID=111803 RepID=A0ABP6QAY4_9ACTN